MELTDAVNSSTMTWSDESEVSWSPFYVNLCPMMNANVSASEDKGSEVERWGYLPLFEFVISLILLLGVALPGLVGNFISVFILSRPQMRTSLNVILIGLASFDSILLVTSILLFVLPTFYSYVGIGEFYHLYIHPIVTPYIFVLATTAQTSSVYLTVGVTVERYVAVCHPLKARSWCTCRRGRAAVVIIGLLSFVYNIPRFFEVDRCIYVDPKLNESFLMIIPSTLRNDKTYVTGYIVTLYFVVMNFVPFTLLAILNTAIYKQVRKANQERSLLTNSQKREIGLATMLLCVVVVFFIFNILAMVVNIFEAANILVDEMTRVSNLLVSVNSSVNFIIYCIFGDKFKRLFLRYFCCAGYMRTPSGRGSPVDPHDNSLVSANFGMGTNWATTEQRNSFSTCGRSSFTSGRMITLSRPIRTYHTAISNGHNRAVSNHVTPVNGYHRNSNGNNMHQTRSSSLASCNSAVGDHSHRHSDSLRHGTRQAILRDDHHPKCKA